MTLHRGDLATVAMPGDFGKPRPVLVMQADVFEHTATVTVLRLTSTLVRAPLLRVTVEPSPGNGLRKPSQVMVDKTMTVRRDRLGDAFGSIESELLLEIERRLAVFLGIAR